MSRLFHVMLIWTMAAALVGCQLLPGATVGQLSRKDTITTGQTPAAEGSATFHVKGPVFRTQSLSHLDWSHGEIRLTNATTGYDRTITFNATYDAATGARTAQAVFSTLKAIGTYACTVNLFRNDAAGVQQTVVTGTNPNFTINPGANNISVVLSATANGTPTLAISDPTPTVNTGTASLATQASLDIRRLAGRASAGNFGGTTDASDAQFRVLGGLVTDSSGNVYVADTGNHQIRMVPSGAPFSGGTVTVVAGTGSAGTAGSDGATAAAATLNKPRALVRTAGGDLYFCDSGNNRVRVVRSGKIYTYAGGGTNTASTLDNALNAQLANPSALAADDAGNLYVAEHGSGRVLKINAQQDMSLVATMPASSVRALAMDWTRKNLWIASGNTIQLVTSAATVPSAPSTIHTAATGVFTGLVFDQIGTLYAASTDNTAVPDGSASTFVWRIPVSAAGVTTRTPAAEKIAGSGAAIGAANSAAVEASVAATSAVNVALASSGSTTGSYNTLAIDIADTNHPNLLSGILLFGQSYLDSAAPGHWGQVLSLSSGTPTTPTATGLSANNGGAGTSITILGTNFSTIPGANVVRVNGVLATVTASTATSITFTVPFDATSGPITVSVGGWTITAGAFTVDGPIITTAAGDGTANFGGDTGAAVAAKLNDPYNVTFDAAGNMYIADSTNHRIRKVAAGTGVITTVVGNGVATHAGDGGLATAASLNAASDIAFDALGNMYIADFANRRIRKVDAVTGNISTISGDGVANYAGDGGLAASAQLAGPTGVAIGAEGELYIADWACHRIRKIDFRTGKITLVAGDGNGAYAGDGAAATAASLRSPTDIACDKAGNLYIADYNNHVVRRVDRTSGIITTVAGNGVNAHAGDGAAATAASVGGPIDVAFDSAGNLFIASWDRSRVRKVDMTTGLISTVAGSGTAPFAGDGGSATAPGVGVSTYGIAFDPAGNLFIADPTNDRIRKVSPMSPAAAVPTVTSFSPTSGLPGSGVTITGTNFPGTTSHAWVSFNGKPAQVVEASSTSLKVTVAAGASTGKVSVTVGGWTGTSVGNFTINQPTITTIMGDGNTPSAGDTGLATAARTASPYGITVDGNGNIYVAEDTGHRIRKIAAGTGIVTTVAGNGVAGAGGLGGAATAANLDRPRGVAVDGDGNIYITDWNNNRVCKVTAATGVITRIAGTGAASSTGDGGLATAATINGPNLIALDTAGNLYVSDFNGNRIRKITMSTGIISTVVGTGVASSTGEGGLATAATINGPAAMALDTAGNLYVADYTSQRIRKVTASTGIISTILGNGSAAFSGEGGLATAATANGPAPLAVDAAGNIYFGIISDHRICRIDALTGVMTTITGDGSATYGGDGGPAALAQVRQPSGLVFDSTGALLFSDSLNHRVRKITF